MEIFDVIDSIDKFTSIVNSIRGRRAFTQVHGLPYRHESYRGQLDSNWCIVPSLARGVKTVQQLAEVEDAVMSLFKRLIRDTNQQHKIFLHEHPISFQNEWLWLSQAQHLGIPTRLLDWTIHPEVALYFALDNEDFDEVDGQFLVSYVPPNNLKIDGPPDRQFNTTAYQDLVGTWFINPSFFWHERYNDITAEVRRARQHGKFSIQQRDLAIVGLNEQPDLNIPWHQDYEAVVIEKYLIPAKQKNILRKALAANGWSGEFLYAKNDEQLNEIIAEVKNAHKNMVTQ